jgi:hypothetical protein
MIFDFHDGYEFALGLLGPEVVTERPLPSANFLL